MVLDGLDEIQLKKFPQIHGMLRGEAYRKCSILATTRPYKAETLNNKMTVLAKIKGFSKQKAEEFISRILTDPKERNNFFLRLESRKMSDMYRIPIIVQAFALLYHENHDLPETYTLTYDELALFLRKTFDSKNTENTEILSDEEIREAMEELNELAFRGLTREYRQLVFSRDEIKNENIFKLGLLTAEKTGSGFKPTTVLQFVHKTVQEHSAADHAVKRLLKNDRGPWETILKEHDNNLRREHDSIRSDTQTKQDHQKSGSGNQMNVTGSKTAIIKGAFQKILDAYSSQPDIVDQMRDFLLKAVKAGAYEDEIDVNEVLQKLSSHSIVRLLTTQEREVMADFLLRQWIMQTPTDWRRHQKNWFRIILEGQPLMVFSKYLLNLRDLFAWIQNDPFMAIDILIKQSHDFQTDDNQPYQYMVQDFTHLLEGIETNKTLYLFISGKLPKDRIKNILTEIAVVAIQHSYDSHNSGVLPFKQLSDFIEDLLGENDPSAKNNPVLSLLWPAMMHLKQEESNWDGEKTDIPVSCAALRMSGGMKNDQSFVSKVSQQLENISSIYTVEIETISLPSDNNSAEICHAFSRALCKSPLVSLELRNINSTLTKALLQNLPETAERLSVATAAPERSPRGSFTLPPIVNLTCLYLEYSVSSIEHMFDGVFQHLKRLSITDDTYPWEDREPCSWREGDVIALKRAVTEGRMPSLENLSIRHISLRGFGEHLVNTVKQPTVKIVDLVNANLGSEDGQHFERSIAEGKLNHVETLTLLKNPELSSISQQLKPAC